MAKKKITTATEAAKQLGVHKSTVSRRLKKAGQSDAKRAGKRAQALTPEDRKKLASQGNKAKGKKKPGPK